MAVNIPSFPCVNREMINEIYNNNDDYLFMYDNDKEICYLETERISDDSNIVCIDDKNGIWNPDDYNLGVLKHFEFKNVNVLFGENGVICNNAVLGVAMEWKSTDSKQRGIIDVGEINRDDINISFDMKFFFQKAQLRGDVEFVTILYIKTPGQASEEEQHLANECGCIVGSLESFCLRLDGNGSIFPIYEINDDKKPLWILNCEWEDPRYDEFSDCISIYINKAHNNYKYLDSSKTRIYNSQLLNEIIASALTIVIMKLKNEECWKDIVEGKGDFYEGSIAQAVVYFITTLEWDITKPELLSYSIRKFLEERM